jgi:hypothetical protein
MGLFSPAAFGNIVNNSFLKDSEIELTSKLFFTAISVVITPQPPQLLIISTLFDFLSLNNSKFLESNKVIL